MPCVSALVIQTLGVILSWLAAYVQTALLGLVKVIVEPFQIVGCAKVQIL